MEKATRVFKALDIPDYKSLAEYLLTSRVDMYTCHVAEIAIVVTASEEDMSLIESFISDKNLDFVEQTIIAEENAVLENPFSNTDSLRRVINQLIQNQTVANEEHAKAVLDFETQLEQKQKIVEMKERDTNRVRDLWMEEMAKTDRVKKQVEAISVMLSSIFPS